MHRADAAALAVRPLAGANELLMLNGGDSLHCRVEARSAWS